jgi:hypothetical protein
LGFVGRFGEQFVPEALMVPLRMVVVHILADDGPKVTFAKRHYSTEALGLDRTHEPLCIGIQIRTSCWQSHGADGSSFEDCAKCLREEWIAIHDEVSDVAQEAVDIVSKRPLRANAISGAVTASSGGTSDKSGGTEVSRSLWTESGLGSP